MSHVRCGAQNPAWLRDPDFDLLEELLQASDGTIRTMTYPPELPGADRLVATLAKHRVIPSLGHTNCSAGDAARSLLMAGQH